jgi:hypothetical protein
MSASRLDNHDVYSNLYILILVVQLEVADYVSQLLDIYSNLYILILVVQVADYVSQLFDIYFIM